MILSLTGAFIENRIQVSVCIRKLMFVVIPDHHDKKVFKVALR